MRRRGPRSVHHEGSHIRTFEAQSHGFGTGCLRFAGRVTPTPRKTRFRLLARLFRAGLVTRRVPSKGFKVYPTSILLSQVQRSARTPYLIAVEFGKVCPNQATADIAMAALGLYSTAMPEVSVKPLDTDSTSISAVCADDYVLAAVPPEPYPGPPGMFSTEFPDEVWFREPLIAPRPAPERLTGDLRLAAPWRRWPRPGRR